MIDYEKIIRRQRLASPPIMKQLIPLWAVSILAAMHTTAMVFMGYNQSHVCEMPLKEKIIKECNISWTEQQTNQYIPWNDEAQSMESCTRYAYDSINCTIWTRNKSQITRYESTNRTEKCDSWTYDTSVIRTTVLGDFDLVCDSKQKGRLSQAVYMFGIMFGVSVWGQFSDKFGRKTGTVATLVIGVGVGIATAFSNSFTLFTILRFFIGFTFFPSCACSYVQEIEIVKSGQKALVGQIFEAIFAVGICALSAIAYFERDWRRLQLWITAPGFVLLIWIWLVTFESPRWLIAKGQYTKAHDVIRKLLPSKEYHQNVEAKRLRSFSEMQTKGEDSADEKLTEQQEDSDEIRVTGDKTANNNTVLDILRFPNMRRKSCILFYIWLVTSAMYYGLTMNTAELGGDVFVNLTLSAIVEIPAAFLALPMMNKWGRRPTVTSTLLLSGVLCICMMFVSKDIVWLNVTLSTIGKFSIATTFGTLYIYAIEIYPTPVRNVGIGVCSSWARIGGMLAPFIAMLDVIGFAVPYVAFGLMAIMAGLLGLLLPETLGKKVPETVEEAEQFGKHYEGIMALLCRENNAAAAAETSKSNEA